jgi:ABC-2 type transport system ATP-binding protein
MKAIEAEEVRKSYKVFFRRKEVLKGISLEVEEGEIYGIIGPNGSGKTTLISILSTILKPDSGNVRVLGMDVEKDAKKIREVINISSGNPNFLWSLTAEENLKYFGMAYGIGGEELKKRIEELLSLLELEEHRETRFDEMSTGTKQRLSLAKALINRPRVVFLDEPTTGLDPDIALKMRETIKRIHEEEGVTIVLTTHYMKEAEMLCEKLSFLRNGVVELEGTVSDFKTKFKNLEYALIRVEGSIEELKIPHAVLSDGKLRVDEIERLGEVIELLSSKGVRIKDVKIREVELEDVFIQLSK